MVGSDEDLHSTLGLGERSVCALGAERKGRATLEIAVGFHPVLCGGPSIRAGCPSWNQRSGGRFSPRSRELRAGRPFLLHYFVRRVLGGRQFETKKNAQTFFPALGLNQVSVSNVQVEHSGFGFRFSLPLWGAAGGHGASVLGAREGLRGVAGRRLSRHSLGEASSGRSKGERSLWARPEETETRQPKGPPGLARKVTPEKPKRALWVVHGLEPLPQFHEKTPFSPSPLREGTKNQISGQGDGKTHTRKVLGSPILQASDPKPCGPQRSWPPFLPFRLTQKPSFIDYFRIGLKNKFGPIRFGQSRSKHPALWICQSQLTGSVLNS